VSFSGQTYPFTVSLKILSRPFPICVVDVTIADKRFVIGGFFFYFLSPPLKNTHWFSLFLVFHFQTLFFWFLIFFHASFIHILFVFNLVLQLQFVIFFFKNLFIFFWFLIFFSFTLLLKFNLILKSKFIVYYFFQFNLYFFDFFLLKLFFFLI